MVNWLSQEFPTILVFPSVRCIIINAHIWSRKNSLQKHNYCGCYSSCKWEAHGCRNSCGNFPNTVQIYIATVESVVLQSIVCVLWCIIIYVFIVQECSQRDQVHELLMAQERVCTEDLQQDNATYQWQARAISNYDYLCYLNRSGVDCVR